MTRQHFQFIADVLKQCLDDAAPYEGVCGIGTGGLPDAAVIRDVAREFANSLHRQNPRFDAGRFLKACGVDQ